MFLCILFILLGPPVRPSLRVINFLMYIGMFYIYSIMHVAVCLLAWLLQLNDENTLVYHYYLKHTFLRSAGWLHGARLLLAIAS